MKNTVIAMKKLVPEYISKNSQFEELDVKTPPTSKFDVKIGIRD